MPSPSRGRRRSPTRRGAWRGATHILLSIPPDGEGDPALNCHGADIAALPGVEWVGYLSTTGVYGDTGGAWVDESASPAPTGVRGRRRLAAEMGWLAFGEQPGLAVHVFRLAGIYGSGRNALATVRRGEARRIDKPGQVFSRIHVADIAQVLAASIARPRPGAIYNVCDDEPAPGADVVAHACALLGVAPPPLTTVGRRRPHPDGAELLRRQPKSFQRPHQDRARRRAALPRLPSGTRRPARRGRRLLLADLSRRRRDRGRPRAARTRRN